MDVNTKYRRWGWGAVIALIGVILIAGLIVAVSMSSPKPDNSIAKTTAASEEGEGGNAESDADAEARAEAERKAEEEAKQKEEAEKKAAEERPQQRRRLLKKKLRAKRPLKKKPQRKVTCHTLAQLIRSLQLLASQ
jgi:FtsZ-interacting cell division protein ZipA